MKVNAKLDYTKIIDDSNDFEVDPKSVVIYYSYIDSDLHTKKRQKAVIFKEDLFNSAEILLNYLPLLFIPVGVGVVMHLSLLEDNLASVVLVIILGTLLTLALTGFVMEKILRKKTLDD